jgi:hypothetical protein
MFICIQLHDIGMKEPSVDFLSQRIQFGVIWIVRQGQHLLEMV